MQQNNIPNITEEDIAFLGKRNELDPRLLGTLALNPFYSYSSSSRMYMFGGHISSSVILNNASKKTIVTMYEREYGKYTFSIKAPCNMTVIKTFLRYDHRYGKGAVKENSQMYVMYMETDNPQNVGIIEIPSYFNLHKDFGFRYVIKKQLQKGDMYLKDEILADSPAVDSDGDWRYGIEANVAFLSVPGIIQDGYIVSESFAKKMSTVVYGKRFIRYGEEDVPLNIYGDEHNFKPYPSVGDRIRSDGLLFAKRKLSNKTLNGTNDIDYSLAPLKLSPKSLLNSNVDYYYDQKEYARPNAKIVDVRVHASSNSKYKTPVGMELHSENFVEQSILFYKKIWAEYEAIRNDRYRHKQHLKILPELQNVLNIAQAEITIAENKKTNKLLKAYKGEPIKDDYLIEIIFEDQYVPLTEGSKITGLHGNKGVVCHIWPDDRMPIDCKGNQCDIIADGDSVKKRTNTGVLYEPCYNAFRRELEETIRSWFGINTKCPTKEEVMRCKSQRHTLDKAWEYALSFIIKASPIMYEYLEESINKKILSKDDFVLSIVEDKMRTVWPQNTAKTWPEIIKDLRDNFPITFGPIEYKDYKGNKVITKDPVLIGEMYFIRLDKLGEDWAGVSSPKISVHGTPSKTTNSDRYSTPGKIQSTRFWGESEVRLGDAFVNPYSVAEQIDRANNAVKHEHIVKRINQSIVPMNIEEVVGCQDYPRGDGRPLQFVNHMLGCAGVKFERHKL